MFASERAAGSCDVDTDCDDVTVFGLMFVWEGEDEVSGTVDAVDELLVCEDVDVDVVEVVVVDDVVVVVSVVVVVLDSVCS